MNAHCLPAFVITTVLQACSDQKSLKNFVGEGLGRRKVEGRGGAVLGLLVAACSHVSKCILELGFRYLISSRPFFFSSCILDSMNYIVLILPHPCTAVQLHEQRGQDLAASGLITYSTAVLESGLSTPNCCR